MYGRNGHSNHIPFEGHLSPMNCAGCKNQRLCFSGKGIALIVHKIKHLFLLDNKNSWTLMVGVPECRQPDRLFSMVHISAKLYMGNRAQVEGKVIEKNILKCADLSVVEIL
jgi:hypothetical protein